MKGFYSCSPTLIAINFPTMADGHQINFFPHHIKTIDQTVIADSQSIFIRAGHAIMLESCRTQTHRINLSLNERLNLRRQAKEIAIEFTWSNLRRRAVHDGSRFVDTNTSGANILLAALNLRFKL